MEFFEPNSEKNRDFENKVKSLFEKNEIKNLHQLFESSFNDFFQGHGYFKHEAVPLLSEEDGSVVFIGASISAVKDLLLSQDFSAVSNGVYVNQECIRTQAIDKVFDNNYIPFGQAYFNMSTILSKPGRFKEVVKEALDFTQNKIDIDSSRLLIKSSKLYKDLRDLGSCIEGVDIEYDLKDPEEYIWQYGMEGIHGEGLGVCVYNEKTKSYWEVGNIVKILDQDGKELGTEFGYGHEFFLTAMLNIDDPSKLSKIFEKYDFKPGLDMKFHSYLETVAKIKEAGAKISGHKEGHIYKKYLKALQFLGQTLSLTEEEIINKILEYDDFSSKKIDNMEEEKKFMLLHRKRKENFKQLVKRISKYLWAVENSKPIKEKINNPKEMIDNYLLQNGINREEVGDVLQRLNRFNI